MTRLLPSRAAAHLTAPALGLLAQSLTAAPLLPQTPPDLVIKIAGSTIWDNTLDLLLKGSPAGSGLCLAGTLSTFKDGDATGKGTYWRAKTRQLGG